MEIVSKIGLYLLENYSFVCIERDIERERGRRERRYSVNEKNERS